MNTSAYLNFPGTCEEAFNFYAKCLNSQIVALIRTGDTLRNAPFTEQSLQSMLDNMGINVRNETTSPRNSPTKTLGEIQDAALNRVRPAFATLPGVSSPPPFGGNQRTIVLSVDPARLRGYGLTSADVLQALVSGNSIQPAGNANIGSSQTLVARP